MNPQTRQYVGEARRVDRDVGELELEVGDLSPAAGEEGKPPAPGSAPSPARA